MISNIVKTHYRVMDNLANAEREANWRRFERDSARRNRIRLIRRNVIVPAYAMPPQMLVKVDGIWKPEIRYVQV